MITIAGADFTRSWLSLSLSHSTKVKGGKIQFWVTQFQPSPDIYGDITEPTSDWGVLDWEPAQPWLIPATKRTMFAGCWWDQFYVTPNLASVELPAVITVVGKIQLHS